MHLTMPPHDASRVMPFYDSLLRYNASLVHSRKHVGE